MNHSKYSQHSAPPTHPTHPTPPTPPTHSPHPPPHPPSSRPRRPLPSIAAKSEEFFGELVPSGVKREGQRCEVWGWICRDRDADYECRAKRPPAAPNVKARLGAGVQWNESPDRNCPELRPYLFGPMDPRAWVLCGLLVFEAGSANCSSSPAATRSDVQSPHHPPLTSTHSRLRHPIGGNGGREIGDDGRRDFARPHSFIATLTRCAGL
jgi:hypothetical protein